MKEYPEQDSNTVGKTQEIGAVDSKTAEKQCHDSDRFRQFSSILAEWGFSGRQMMLIDDALREVGLEIRATSDEG